VGGVDVHLLRREHFGPVLVVSVEVARRGVAFRVGEVDVAGVGRDVDLVGRLQFLELLRHRRVVDAVGHLHRLRVDGVEVVHVLIRVVRELAAHGVELAPVRGVVRAGEVQHAEAVRFAVEYHRARLHVVVVAAGVDAEVAPRLRHFAVEVDAARVDGAERCHGRRVDDLHGGFVAVRLGEGISARVGHIEPPVVEAHALRLPPCGAGGHDLLCAQVYLGHVSLLESLAAAPVGIRRDVEVAPVGAHPAVVGHVLRGAARRAVRVDVLDDVGPVHGDGNQRVVDEQDVVRRVAELKAVPGAEPLVGQHARGAVVIRELAVVRLPVAFVADDEAFELVAARGHRRGRRRLVRVG